MLLEELCQLAREDAPDKRRDLLRRVSDLFLANAERCAEDHVALFEDVIARVLDMVEEDARREFAERIAAESRFPRGVVIKLAHDTAPVARPVLEESPILTDADLVTIAHVKGDAHRLAIARRRGLAETVSDILLRKGSSTVAATIAANRGARLSRNGFVELARKARINPGLQARLLARPDLSPETIEALVPVLSAELLARLLNQGYAVGRQISVEIAGKIRRRLTSLLAVKKVEALQLSQLVADIRGARRGLGVTIVELAADERVADIADLLAVFLDMPANQVLGALIAREADMLVVLIRSLSLDARVLDALMRLRAHRFKYDASADATVFARFRDLRAEVAQRAIRFHKIRAGMAAAMGAAA